MQVMIGSKRDLRFVANEYKSFVSYIEWLHSASPKIFSSEIFNCIHLYKSLCMCFCPFSTCLLYMRLYGQLHKDIQRQEQCKSPETTTSSLMHSCFNFLFPYLSKIICFNKQSRDVLLIIVSQTFADYQQKTINVFHQR